MYDTGCKYVRNNVTMCFHVGSAFRSGYSWRCVNFDLKAANSPM